MGCVGVLFVAHLFHSGGFQALEARHVGDDPYSARVGIQPRQHNAQAPRNEVEEKG